MSAKQFKVQFGESTPSLVDEAGLAAIKKTFGTRFSEFTVTEVAAPAPKPADITKPATEVKPEGKKPKAE